MYSIPYAPSIESLPTKLVDFVRANVGKSCSTMVRIWLWDGFLAMLVHPKLGPPVLTGAGRNFGDEKQRFLSLRTIGPVGQLM